MNCDTLRQQLDAGSWPRGAEVEAHLADCETCAEELARRSGVAPAAGDADASDPDLDALFRDIEHSTNADKGIGAWLASRPTPARYAMAAAAGALVVAFWWVGGPRVDLAHYPPTRLLAELGVLVALAIAAAVVALRPLFRPALSTRTYVALGAAGVLSALLLTSLPPAHVDHPASLLGVGADLLPRAVGCLVVGTASALAPLVALLALDRNRAKGRSATLIGALGASLFGFAAILIHCPLVHSTHQWAGHLPILAVVVALGLAVHRFADRRVTR